MTASDWDRLNRKIGNFDRLTRYLMEASLSDPIVHAAFHSYLRTPEVDDESFLLQLVEALLAAKNSAQAALVEYMERNGPVGPFPSRGRVP